MVEYSFKMNSKIDDNLTKAWEVWQKKMLINGDGGDFDDNTWCTFLTSLSTVDGVTAGTVSDDQYQTTITFSNESALSMFLLKWG